jgi:hypothetical protein
MKDKELAKQTDLDAHVEQPWNYAHGIWAKVKAKIPYFVETPSVYYTPTVDGTWHEVSVSGAPSNSVIIAVFSVYWQGDADADSFYFYTRKKGSSAAYEGIAAGAGRHGSMIFQVIDADNKYEYKSTVVSAAVYTITQVGYLVIPK